MGRVATSDRWTSLKSNRNCATKLYHVNQNPNLEYGSDIESSGREWINNPKRSLGLKLDQTRLNRILTEYYSKLNNIKISLSHN